MSLNPFSQVKSSQIEFIAINETNTHNIQKPLPFMAKRAEPIKIICPHISKRIYVTCQVSEPGIILKKTQHVQKTRTELMNLKKMFENNYKGEKI